MVTGFLATLLLDETSQMTLEDMTHEQQQHFISGKLAFGGMSVNGFLIHRVT